MLTPVYPTHCVIGSYSTEILRARRTISTVRSTFQFELHSRGFALHTGLSVAIHCSRVFEALCKLSVDGGCWCWQVRWLLDIKKCTLFKYSVSFLNDCNQINHSNYLFLFKSVGCEEGIFFVQIQCHKTITIRAVTTIVRKLRLESKNGIVRCSIHTTVVLCKCSVAKSVSINFGTSNIGKSSGKGFDGGLVNKVNFLFELLIIESWNVANPFENVVGHNKL